MAKLIKNGKFLTADGVLNKIDLLIENDTIIKIEKDIDVAGNEVIDVEGKLVVPGFVDLHVHLREPGGEYKETIATGTLAAARGGFTSIAAMPNTRPVPDSKEQLEWLNKKIKEDAVVRVLPYGAITVRELGKELTNFSELAESGAFAFTDDGVGVQNANMMLAAMKEAKKVNKAIVAHCEEETLINKGSVHEGEFSEKMGLRGIPSVCESVHIARDVLLAEATGVHYHVCHISTKESVRVVRDAKRAGVRVTAEVTPHHLLLSDEDIPGLDTNYKMNPPLRGPEDKVALIEGLLDGTIDFIATDHAPHSLEEKSESIELSPFGIVGLETAFPLLYTYFVEKEIITLKELVTLLTSKPCEAFGLPYGTLEVGGKADITVIDLNHTEKIDPDNFLSKGKNTPFAGWECKGWPVLTIVNGEIAWKKEGATA
ncbi:dihydroorotase [Anaerobacillus alkalidiazotrophicus]|uniref:Dihydroorotase n=1 Tax=Anaerobacillus alkalidiazotrophicus TaxID=472963 RepID=A0A1S2M1G5_9BACI|nr:dihydroorotase [Anaerobacillus alkalidiazotrophicus]OIJ17767.1 dihydroorotase [Anaerobacillus alkalidiazotrophicus]